VANRRAGPSDSDLNVSLLRSPQAPLAHHDRGDRHMTGFEPAGLRMEIIHSLLDEVCDPLKVVVRCVQQVLKDDHKLTTR